MNRWLTVGLVMAVAVAGCSGGGEFPSPVGAPTSIVTVPDPPVRPAPPDSSIIDQPDYAASREIVGEWELVSFTGDDTGPRTVYFDYLRSDETGRRYWMRSPGGCRGFWGSYIVSGERIWIAGGGAMTLEWRGCESDSGLRSQDLAFSYLMSEAETWAVEGERLVLTTTTGEVGVFTRIGHGFGDELTVDDGLETVVPRVHFVDDSGFMVLLQEQEDADQIHEAEQVNWVAWEFGNGDQWLTDRVASPNSWVWPDMRSRDSFVAVPFDFPPATACVLADMQSVHGDNPASLRYRDTVSGVELLVDEEESTSVETGHTDEITGALVVNCRRPFTYPGVEVGSVEAVTHEWHTVPAAGTYEDPVVVAGPASLNGADPGVVEIRNVSSDSFEIRFKEWDYLDGRHPAGESVSFIMAERGTTVLPDGTQVVAGTTVATTSIRSVSFPSEFAETPVLISTLSH